MSTETTMLDRLRGGIGHKIGPYSPTPVGQWLNGSIVDADENGIALAFDVLPEMANPVEMLHGGYTALLLDEVIGGTTMILSNGNFYATINLAIDFLNPAAVGDVVTVRTRVLRKGRRLWNVQGKITRQDGVTVARASANLIAADA